MAVEQDLLILPEPPQERHAGRQLINEEYRRLELCQLSTPCDGQYEMYLSQNGTEDLETSEDGSGKQRVTSDSYVKGAISGFVEAMIRIAVGCEDGDLVTYILQANSCIDHKAFGAANAEIGMEEDDVLAMGM